MIPALWLERTIDTSVLILFASLYNYVFRITMKVLICNCCRLHLHRPASIHPKKAPVSGSFEEYCALAEFVAEDSSQVSFNAGDKVVVMSKDESG